MKIAKPILIAATVAVAALNGAAVMAQSKPDQTKLPASATTDASGDMTDGEIRKIDLDAGKVTIKHGEIRNLEMPGMTMVFEVREKSMLEKVKTGEKIKFKVVSENGKMIVTEIQPTK